MKSQKQMEEDWRIREARETLQKADMIKRDTALIKKILVANAREARVLGTVKAAHKKATNRGKKK